MLVLIAASNKYGLIGKDNHLPWHHKEDLAHFKKTTMGHKLVMGRKTYEGLGKSLPGRKLYIVSRSAQDENTIRDFEAFLKREQDSEELFFIAGGAEIYRQALPYAKGIILSLIPNDMKEGTVYFPDFSLKEFNIDKRTDYADFEVIEYRRTIK